MDARQLTKSSSNKVTLLVKMQTISIPISQVWKISSFFWPKHCPNNCRKNHPKNSASIIKWPLFSDFSPNPNEPTQYMIRGLLRFQANTLGPRLDSAVIRTELSPLPFCDSIQKDVIDAVTIQNPIFFAMPRLSQFFVSGWCISLLVKDLMAVRVG